MNWLAVLSVVSRVFAALVAVCYFYQIVYLFVPLLLKKKRQKPVFLHRYAVLIAARNEATVIPYLLESIADQTYPRQLLDVYVVADNCTDETAAVAAAGGARVYVRENRQQVGKGYALQYLLEQVRKEVGLNQYDAFLIFDADNVLDSDYITQINGVCSDGYAAFCGYRNTKNFGNNWLTACHGLWYIHESCHLNQSRMLLETCCAVSGTGFGFTRELLEQAGGWNFLTLTEDLEFGTWCVTNGIRIGYCHDAVLYDEQPEQFSQSWRQRTRWIQGGIQVSLRYAGALFRGMCKGGRMGYASFETATLSFWGYGAGAVSGMLTLLTAGLCTGWLGLGKFLVMGMLGTLGTFFCIGGLTLLTEWKRIRATKKEKLIGLLLFPVYMLTFVPITVSALFRKAGWPPISHTAAISAKSLQKK